ncbi:MAG TPA: adenylate/guanylate cyclase domain-containing protein [Coleofasciculaceae cyanobacterium]
MVKPIDLFPWLKKEGYLRSAGLDELRSHFPFKAATILLFSLVVTGGVGGIKQLGGLEFLELRVYDQMMRSRPDRETDSRLVLVTITEEDIRLQKQSTLPDRTIAKVLSTLEQYQPIVIGLDLYRDVSQPPGYGELQTQFRSSRLIAITKLGDDENAQVPPPPGVSSDRIGFNDFPVDPDGVVRRSLLFGGQYSSFSLQLALRYLKTLDIAPVPSPTNPENMQLGAATFVPLEADSGGYQINDSQGYQMLLDYRTRHWVGRQITLDQVLKGNIQPEWIRGKIVLIGTTAPSSRDLFYTPYSAGETNDHQMSGVEIHAQIVSQLLSVALEQQPQFWFFSNGQEWLWLWLWSVVAGTVAACIRHPFALMMSCAVLLSALAGTSFLLFLESGWVPVVTPAIAALLTMGVVVVQQAQQARQQQQMVMTLLGQNTSKEIADALWSHHDRLLSSGKLPGQRLMATILFTDIQNFSTISESIPPETLLDWLNEYLGAMIQEVQRHQGIINKFTGDGLLAVFGVPIPRLSSEEIDRDAYNAVACALAMGDRLSQLNQTWQQQGLPVVQMRVGISTGAIVVGSLGNKERMEYGVIGDSVNTASRLESCAKEMQKDLCRVLMSGETFKHIQDKFLVENWGSMTMKGKQNQVEVYHVIGKNM